jgi:aspartate aminotransferase
MSTTLDFSEKLLTEAHVAVVPGEAFGTRQHVRISYATSMHELERGLARLRDFLASAGGGASREEPAAVSSRNAS